MSDLEILNLYNSTKYLESKKSIVNQSPVFDGITTFIDRATKLDDFFSDDEVVFYKNINDLIPENFKSGSKYKRTGKAGIFAGSLELVKEGNLSIKQDKLFDDIYIKEKGN